MALVKNAGTNLKVTRARWLYLSSGLCRSAPRVDYQLTDFGREASDRLFDLTDWLENNISQLLEQQPRSDTV